MFQQAHHGSRSVYRAGTAQFQFRIDFLHLDTKLGRSRKKTRNNFRVTIRRYKNLSQKVFVQRTADFSFSHDPFRNGKLV
jgi:hypothetical protein